MLIRVALTEIRPRLTELLTRVTGGAEQVVLTRHGRPVAALVPMDDLRRIWDEQDEERIGPINPATGRPFGRAWVETVWQGRYRRADDPDAHLHPRREEAPWLGRPFDWPRPPEAAPEPDAAPEPTPETAPEAEAEAPAEPRPAEGPAEPRGWRWLHKLRGKRAHRAN